MAAPPNKLGFDLSHAESAVAALSAKIIEDTPEGRANRKKMYSAGLKRDMSYAIKKGRQRDMSSAKLVALLAACESLEVSMSGELLDGQQPKWVIRAHRQDQPPVSDSHELTADRPVELGRPLSDIVDRPAPDRASGPSEPLQMSLFGSLQAVGPIEIELQSSSVTKRGPNRADLRIDFAIRSQQAG